MLVRIKRAWELPERAATPEAVYMDRRRLVQGLALAPLVVATGPLLNGSAARAQEVDPSVLLYPVRRNEAYVLDRPVTEEALPTSYNNFYEFGSHKRIARLAQRLPIRPWTVKFDGMVEEEMAIDIDDLLKKMPLEERLYRHRCVEAWSMAVPWSGFPLKALVEMARPSAGAKYLKMTTFEDPDIAPGQKAVWYPWPYVEGLTLEEATSELAFIATGLYGKPIPKQNGAPLRLVTPWKYGFKSVKSIVSFTFTDQQPLTFWWEIAPSEYGFWANVNPAVDHPRWSQKTEQPLGADDRVPTLLYNGYAEQVAHLYKELEASEGDRLYR
ncbi:MAG: protein-methionine-sulfoxide reductase catalytic subunit MsrP [Rhodospirillales bacterium]|nr:protein-methionine-sulfoxide reductase catalytic subunit MsrP [Rhodospirillales bacterium]